jgi:uncharacterized UPF0160 family protein
MKKLITHNGSFHADEVFAIATLQIVLANEVEVIRTREENIINTGDFVVDVGGVYDELKDRFDHHQKNGVNKRENGIPYASFGLVWKKYGLTICGNQSIVDEIDNEIVEAIDAVDNGIDIYKITRYKIRPFTISDIVHSFNSTWKETDRSQDQAFFEAVSLAKNILQRLIARVKDKFEAGRFVTDAYNSAIDKRLIILDGNYPAKDILCTFSEPLYVIKPTLDLRWNVEALKDDPRSFKNRKDLPKKWGGKSGLALQKITGVSDAIFCHKNLFLAVANSKEGAIALAQKALM